MWAKVVNIRRHTRGRLTDHISKLFDLRSHASDEITLSV